MEPMHHGKSNLLKAISFAQDIIKNGNSSNYSNLYCRINKENKEKISTFDFEIKLDDKYYSYGFDILLSKNSVEAEWLYELDKNKNTENKIFVRKIREQIDVNINYLDNEMLNKIHLYAEDIETDNKILFLTVMNRNKQSLYKETKNNIIVFNKIYNWFNKELVVIFPQLKQTPDSLYISDGSIDKITEIVSTFGTGISKCKCEEIKLEELYSKVNEEKIKEIINFVDKRYEELKKLNKEAIGNFTLRLGNELYIIERKKDTEINVRNVKFEHKNNSGLYAFNEESDGTIRILDLIEILINNNSNKTYLVDEIDRCLHPQLTYEFIRRFLNDIENKKTQLIVTTHESRLLNFDLLRRDEVWFTDRQKNGPTKLYSLEDYNERFDKKIDKAYLEGRYGGVPIFETVFPIKGDGV